MKLHIWKIAILVLILCAYSTFAKSKRSPLGVKEKSLAPRKKLFAKDKKTQVKISQVDVKYTSDKENTNVNLERIAKKQDKAIQTLRRINGVMKTLLPLCVLLPKLKKWDSNPDVIRISRQCYVSYLIFTQLIVSIIGRRIAKANNIDEFVEEAESSGLLGGMDSNPFLKNMMGGMATNQKKKISVKDYDLSQLRTLRYSLLTKCVINTIMHFKFKLSLSIDAEVVVNIIELLTSPLALLYLFNFASVGILQRPFNLATQMEQPEMPETAVKEDLNHEGKQEIPVAKVKKPTISQKVKVETKKVSSETKKLPEEKQHQPSAKSKSKSREKSNLVQDRLDTLLQQM